MQVTLSESNFGTNSPINMGILTSPVFYPSVEKQNCQNNGILPWKSAISWSDESDFPMMFLYFPMIFPMIFPWISPIFSHRQDQRAAWKLAEKLQKLDPKSQERDHPVRIAEINSIWHRYTMYTYIHIYIYIAYMHIYIYIDKYLDSYFL